MELQISSNKLYPNPQQISIPQSLLMMIGENGCGKSAILEKVFQEYIEDPEKQVICFTSGLNESYSPIFNAFIRKSRRYLIDPENQDIDAAFRSFYFHSGWSKVLIFFATALKREGRVRQYFKERGYCNVSNDGLNDDISSALNFTFRIDTWYIRTIQAAVEKEANEPEFRSIRKTVFHRLLSYLAEKYINPDFDFEKSQRRRHVWLAAKDVATVLNGAKENEIFTFLSLATKDSRFINLWACELNLKGLKINDLSDGEYQILTVYAILDLFDSQNTIFLFDEIDSHLHYQNVQKLWESLQTIQGRIITTTHSADSIISNQPETIKLVERGKIEAATTPVEIFKRLECLSENDTYSFKMMARLPYIALVENVFDWFVFKNLCEIKVGKEETERVLSQVCAIPRSSNYDRTAQVFGKAKIDWCKKFFERNSNQVATRHIFLICDKDNLNPGEVGPDCRVHKPHGQRVIDEIGNQNNSNKVSLLSWKRREIENYFLSKTLLTKLGKLKDVHRMVASIHRSSLSNGNNEGLTDLDVKSFFQQFYLKEGYTAPDPEENGVDYQKLQNVISKIPAIEISKDIENMFVYLKNKIDN